MARSEGISWKNKIVLTVVAAIATTCFTGCDVNDDLKSVREKLLPSFNNEDRLLVDPTVYTGVAGHLAEDDSLESEGPEEGLGEVTTTFAELPYTAVSATTYSSYLNSEVYEPLRDLVVDSGLSGSLYLRVFHAGYEPYGEGEPYIKKGSNFDNKMVGSLSRIGGTALQEFAMDYLYKYFDNRDYVSKLISNWEHEVSKLSIDETAKWEEVAQELTESGDATERRLAYLWGNPDMCFATFSDYMDSFDSESISAIPNLSLKLEIPSSTSVKLNNVDFASSRYQDFMLKSDVDKLFSSYNFSEQRDRAMLTFHEEQAKAIVYAYVDGYTKTLVVLACEPDKTLDSLLGSRLGEIKSIFSSIRNYTEWEYISEVVEDAVLLQSGSRGVN